MNIENTKLFCKLENSNSEFINGIKNASKRVTTQLANRIPNLFPEYTLHDIGHSLRVIDYIADLIGDLTQLTELEIAILIHSALLHDIGMAIGKDQIDDIKQGSLDRKDLHFEAMKNHFKGSEKRALQEFVRIKHAEMSAEIIKSEYNEFMSTPELESTSFSDDVATICANHTKPIHSLSSLSEYNVKGRYSFNTDFRSTQSI